MSTSPATSSHSEVNPKEISTFADEKAPVTPITESHENHSDVNTAEEDKLVRKIDLHLLPILFVLYMFAFLDRVNIGNAKIQGLTTELHMSGTQYNVASMILFVPYILLEVPSNLLMKRIRPSMWLGGLMFFWGIITMCQGFVKSYAGLIVCRVLLGVFEAGVFPGKPQRLYLALKSLTICRSCLSHWDVLQAIRIAKAIGFLLHLVDVGWSIWWASSFCIVQVEWPRWLFRLEMVRFSS